MRMPFITGCIVLIRCARVFKNFLLDNERLMTGTLTKSSATGKSFFGMMRWKRHRV